MTRFLAEQLSTPHWYDISAAERDFGYHPRVSVAEGLARPRPGGAGRAPPRAGRMSAWSPALAAGFAQAARGPRPRAGAGARWWRWTRNRARACAQLEGKRVELALESPPIALSLTVRDGRPRIGPPEHEREADLGLRANLAGLFAQLPLRARPQRAGAEAAHQRRCRAGAHAAGTGARLRSRLGQALRRRARSAARAAGRARAARGPAHRRRHRAQPGARRRGFPHRGIARRGRPRRTVGLPRRRRRAARSRRARAGARRAPARRVDELAQGRGA